MNTAEERAEAAAIDVEGRQARIAEILQAPNSGSMADRVRNLDAMISAQVANMPRPARAKRKDAGKPRPKKAEPAAQVAGALTQEQRSELDRVLNEVERTRSSREISQRKAGEDDRAYTEACAAAERYLDSITAK